MKCRNCKLSTDDGSKFCKNCGAEVDINHKWKIGLICLLLFFTFYFLTLNVSTDYFVFTFKPLVIYLVCALVGFIISWFLIEKYKEDSEKKSYVMVGLFFCIGTVRCLLEIIITGYSDAIYMIFSNGILAYISYLIIKHSHKKTKSRREEFEKKIRMENLGILYTSNLSHSCGLPCILNSNVVIELYKDYMMFILDNEKTVKLMKEKIKSVNTKTEKELMEAYSKAQTTGGLGGAIIGGLTFGALGAIVGAGISQKSTNGNTTYKCSETYFFIINYVSNNETNSIALSSDSLEKINYLVSNCNNIYLEKNIVL